MNVARVRAWLFTVAVLTAVDMTSATPAFAQDDDSGDDQPAPKPKRRRPVDDDEDDDEAPKAAPPPTASAGAREGASAAPTEAAAAPQAQTATDGPPQLPKLIVGLERLAGFSYATAAPDQGNDSGSFFIVNAGGMVLNPFAAPRLALDYKLSGQIYLGGALSFATSSISASNNGSSQDVASLTIYTLTPRLGYALPLNSDLTIMPRAGLTLAGGSAKAGSDGASYGVFSTAISLEGAAYFKLIGPVSVIGAVALDRTLSASVSQSDSKGSSSSSDIKGVLMTVQAWGGFGLAIP